MFIIWTLPARPRVTGHEPGPWGGVNSSLRCGTRSASCIPNQPTPRNSRSPAAGSSSISIAIKSSSSSSSSSSSVAGSRGLRVPPRRPRRAASVRVRGRLPAGSTPRGARPRKTCKGVRSRPTPSSSAPTPRSAGDGASDPHEAISQSPCALHGGGHGPAGARLAPAPWGRRAGGLVLDVIVTGRDRARAFGDEAAVRGAHACRIGPGETVQGDAARHECGPAGAASKPAHWFSTWSSRLPSAYRSARRTCSLHPGLALRCDCLIAAADARQRSGRPSDRASGAARSSLALAP
eukprot:scaffold659_cov329-Prasinococcus_capsulatus_cf.AAC.4